MIGFSVVVTSKNDEPSFQSLVALAKEMAQQEGREVMPDREERKYDVRFQKSNKSQRIIMKVSRFNTLMNDDAEYLLIFLHTAFSNPQVYEFQPKLNLQISFKVPYK